MKSPKYLLIFLLLFFIPFSSANVVFQENFNTQTIGNFSLFAGNYNFIFTIYDYSIYNSAYPNLILRSNIIITNNFSYNYDFYVGTPLEFDHVTSFYDDTITNYYEFVFSENHGMYIDCNDGITYDYIELPIIISDYKDINNWVHLNITRIDNFINIEANNNNIASQQFTCNFNPKIIEFITNQAHPQNLFDNFILSFTFSFFIIRTATS